MARAIVRQHVPASQVCWRPQSSTVSPANMLLQALAAMLSGVHHCEHSHRVMMLDLATSGTACHLKSHPGQTQAASPHLANMLPQVLSLHR